MSLVLTDDQQAAKDEFISFLADPIETVFVLEGYSGTGKSTLVAHLLDNLPNLMKTVRLINPKAKSYQVELTATTNKAAEALAHISGSLDVTTIHSKLGLRVQTDSTTGKSTLVPSRKDYEYGKLLFIDEASYIDSHLLSLIFKSVKDCKIVFMGDPAQLTPVMSTSTPVFNAGFRGAKLSQVVRQAEGNPIVGLSTKFRETVETGEFFQFKPDGSHVQHMPRDLFEKEIIAEFSRPDWKYHCSKILGWTNKCVIGYNRAVNEVIKGDPDFQVGDYAICNKYVNYNRMSIKTDETVLITEIGPDTSEYGIAGNKVTLNNRSSFFMPKHRSDAQSALKHYRDAGEFKIAQEIDQAWIDLRAAFAQTVNKSQGSTYDRVFIDLDDISRCNSGEQIARMMYVGVSRARTKVMMTGDFV